MENNSGPKTSMDIIESLSQGLRIINVDLDKEYVVLNLFNQSQKLNCSS